MHSEQRAIADGLLRSHGINCALFANPLSVGWLTGYVPPVPLGGRSPFSGGPLLVWYAGGEFVFIVPDTAAADAAASACPLVTYTTYSVDEPIAGAVHLADVLRAVAGRSALTSTAVGVEAVDLPVSLWSVILAGLPSTCAVVHIDGWLKPHQMIKTEAEIAALRASFALTDVGHHAARGAVRAGRREIDVWTDVEAAIQRAAGRRLSLGNDCVVGYRQNNVGGWPEDLEIRAGDAVIVDLSVVYRGYHSDSAATYYAGEPSAKQQDMHRTVARALEQGLALIKPGAVACDIDRSVRQCIAAAGHPVYAHHTGHGVGLSPHEDPRIVPYNRQVLAQGMVLMLEPGIYYPGETGVRLEDAVLVTDTGAEVLTHHDKSLP
jgi:Xaa-Pro aminopeptidase